jgi:DNA-binding protein HU-beta
VPGKEIVNKSELVEALASRLDGNRKAAATALEALLDEITRALVKGDRVGITGFGTFEKRERPARVARNPRTGEAVKVKKTSVPAFRPGAEFKDIVAGRRKLAKAAPAKSAPVKASGTRAAAAKTAPARKTAAKKAAPAKSATRKASPAKKSVAKSAARKAPAKRAR